MPYPNGRATSPCNDQTSRTLLDRSLIGLKRAVTWFSRAAVFLALSMDPSMHLALLGLLLSLHCVHGMQRLAVDDIFSAVGASEPAPIPAEPAYYDDATVELCFKETGACPDEFIDFGDDGYIDDSHIVTEFACPGSVREGNKMFAPVDTPVAGLCVLNNEDERQSTSPPPDQPWYPGVSTPSASDLAFDFQFSATCYLKEKLPHECDMKGFEGYTLDIHGAVIKSATVVINREPRAAQPPVRCNGKNLEDNCIDGLFSPTCNPQNRRSNPTPEQRKPGRDTTHHNSTRMPVKKGTAKRQPVNRQDGERTYWVGPARIWMGVVYAHPRRPSGRMQVGHFQYVRPQHIFDDDCQCNLFEEITESQLDGRRVYTPFEYVIQLSPNGNERQGA